MKKFMMFLFVASLLGLLTVAGVAGPGGQGAAPKAAPKMGGTQGIQIPAGELKTVYMCAHCEVAKMEPGECPSCHKPFKQEKARIAYGCKTHREAYFKEAGKCTKCQSTLRKVAYGFWCSVDKNWSKGPAKCKTCGNRNKPYTIPILTKNPIQNPAAEE